MDFDPQAALASIAVPILALFGEADTVTPPAASAAAFRAAARPDLLTVRTFPAAGHRLGAGEPPELAAGVLDEIVAFLDRVTPDPRGS
jgi:pimeloyl-ACP methyl ester carboxylesterase